ncbi:protein translocase SEC61 complex subunit gamma [Halorubellus sp. JP-L1]|uniref:protein translocase SEC61 complex subunit gamma n=1 Tax=Halorubellus sp. JP-L1 TaxID=2715753 RepID=UPI001408F702|nr:protein translocase SEC61 complex subunit gamma [Halorubellus sp. JP-L1]NHN42399.1 protein translocase SEC61 complex subunit gamma [Halorubellus sp. JP-L1]
MELPTELSSYVRVLKLASTPSFTEFSQIAKIAGAGIVLVGILGFIIAQFMSLLVTSFITDPAAGGAALALWW